MGVGSIGAHLAAYEESDTFLSTDGGVQWKMIRREAHKYEFGDQGSILVAINDEEGIDTVNYSTDFGETWFVIHSRHRLSNLKSVTLIGNRLILELNFAHAGLPRFPTLHRKSSCFSDSFLESMPLLMAVLLLFNSTFRPRGHASVRKVTLSGGMREQPKTRNVSWGTR
jgi:hypothetical protein